MARSLTGPLAMRTAGTNGKRRCPNRRYLYASDAVVDITSRIRRAPGLSRNAADLHCFAARYLRGRHRCVHYWLAQI
jgi:hypothetical protein